MPGAEGRGRSEGMEPPWKSLSVMVLPLTFFFDILPHKKKNRERIVTEEDKFQGDY